jgi:hypothetical protein
LWVETNVDDFYDDAEERRGQGRVERRGQGRVERRGQGRVERRGQGRVERRERRMRAIVSAYTRRYKWGRTSSILINNRGTSFIL